MERYDFLLFVALWVIVFIFLDIRLRRPPRNSHIPWQAWTLLGSILVASWFIVNAVDKSERNEMKHLVEGIAPTYAREMERMGHERLSLDTKSDDPLYLSLIEAEKRWLNANPSVADIYTLKMLPGGRYAFMVDSETDYNHDGKIEGEREERTAIGEIYPSKDEGFEKAFTGQPNFDDIPSTDRWGTWVTAVEPLYDAQGRVDGILGVDYDAHLWKQAIEQSRQIAMFVISLLLGVIAVATQIITYLKSLVQQREMAEEAMKEAKRSADEASAAKGEFLANMSHEIRTPLNGVIGMTHLLNETPLTAEQRDLLETLKESADFLTTLLNNILDFSKIEAGKMMIEEAPFDLRACIESICKSMVPLCREKNIEIFYAVDASIPRKMIGDVYRLRQVLTNLLGNAVKFTDQGKVEIRVLPEGRGLRFEVWDTGIGIPMEKQHRVFDSFAQADSSTTRRYGGSGLGLTISSKLVFLMGGALEMESEPGQGTIFWFSLPMKPASEEEALMVADVEKSVAPEMEPLRILLGEDNPVNCRVAVGLLETAGAEVVVAQHGRRLIEIWETDTNFDAILVDVQMPEMDGLTATRFIREAEKKTGHHIPIIALTAYTQSEDRRRCLEAGADAYLPKPIDPAELFAALARITIGERTVDREKFRKHLGSDPVFLRDLFEIFEGETAKNVPVIVEAMRAGDQEMLMRTAHALKGSVGNFCAQRVFEQASRLEDLARSGDIKEAKNLWPHLEKSLKELSQDLKRIISEIVPESRSLDRDSPRAPS